MFIFVIVVVILMMIRSYIYYLGLSVTPIVRFRLVF